MVSGVYVPAMIRKMLAWSSRRRTPSMRGLQSPRWYSALTPNSRQAVSA